MSLSHAEATYLIARSTGVAISQEFLKAAEMQDGEVLYCMGQPEDDVVRMRTEKKIPAYARVRLLYDFGVSYGAPEGMTL